MSLNRYAKKRDANEGPIRKALEDADCSVEPLDIIDLLVEHRPTGRIKLLEVKTRKGKLTPRQVAFRQRFTTHVVRSIEDAMAAVDAVSRADPAPGTTGVAASWQAVGEAAKRAYGRLPALSVVRNRREDE